MCGIFGIISSKKNLAPIVLNGLKSLEYRGYDSWGVAIATPGGKPSTTSKSTSKNAIQIKKKAGKIGDASVSELPAGTVSFGHTRWATHGGATDTNAHPHLDCSGKIAVIHNGVFENYQIIKDALQKKGHLFISGTDSEVIAHLIEDLHQTQPFIESVKQAFTQMEGLNGLIALDSATAQLIAAKNGSPLVLGVGKNENYLASDPAALLPYTTEVYFMEDGELAIVEQNSIKVQKISTGETVPFKTQHLNWDIKQAEKGTFPYFMIKEIYEQPAILEKIMSEAVADSIQKVAQLIKKSQKLYLVGCGSSYYEAVAGSYFFAQVAQRAAQAISGSEFHYSLNYISSKDAVVALSQSGETMDILEPVKQLQAKKISVVALLNVFGSSLNRLADESILIGVGPEKAVATTKAFTGKIAYLLLLAYELIGERAKAVEQLGQAIKSAQALLQPANITKIRALAQTLKHTKHLFVIGRGTSYPASLETALKIKEISYIHAEGLAAGELKHGPLALVTKDTPCIVFLPNDETYAATLTGAMELKARGGYIIGISYKPSNVFDFYIEVQDAQHATIIPNVMVSQLLSYYLALELGLDPDMPRNLAKSVTVK